MGWLDPALAVAAVWAALAMRPRRALGGGGPPWFWLAWCALLPALRGADRCVAMPVAQPLSGACLLMLMMGWPLAVLALVPVAALTMLLTELPYADALARCVRLGVMPATLAMALGRALAAWGDAFITGMFAAIFVAFRPQRLATYTDRLYLPGAPR